VLLKNILVGGGWEGNTGIMHCSPEADPEYYILCRERGLIARDGRQPFTQ